MFMSRNLAILSKTASQAGYATDSDSPSAATVPTASVPASGDYSEVIRQLFKGPAAVAVVGGNRGAEHGVSRISENLASELAITGKRVIVVVVTRVLQMNPIAVPHEADFTPSKTPHVWTWAPPGGRKTEVFKSLDVCDSGNWLDRLRRTFDAVLLDCPGVEETPGVSEVAAMADAALLVVEAGHTSKRQLQHDQWSLLLRGATVAGFILVQRS
jgi:Mrp family chromosome partitioning ATPase